MARFGQTGVWSHLAPVEPRYGDFSVSMELAEAMNLIDEAEAAFEVLPAKVRAAAENDPVRFAEMLASPEGVDILEKAGLPIDREISDHQDLPPRSLAEPPSPPAEGAKGRSGSAPDEGARALDPEGSARA